MIMLKRHCGVLCGLLASSAFALPLGCSAAGGDAESSDETGSVVAMLAQVPGDARCVVLYTSDSRVKSVAQDVIPGAASSIVLSPLTVGSVRVRGEAYSSTCATRSNDAGASKLTWDAPWTTTTVGRGQSGELVLVFQPVSALNVKLDFQDQADAGPSDGGTPTEFWATSDIPAAANSFMFKFLNRTNGKYPDSDVYWRITSGGVTQTHSIAEQPFYDMPAGTSGRVYFFIGEPASSKYSDFIEMTVSATMFGGNTTRVDAFGLKTAMRLHCDDGYEATVGEDAATFAEDRAATFQKFIDAVPTEFKHLAQVQAPYKIIAPAYGEFKAGGAYATYFDSWIDELWAANGLGMPKAGPACSGLGSYPKVMAACERHVGVKNGVGTLNDSTLFNDASTFYTAAPTDYYAKFWHDHSLGGKTYAFAYDDVGDHASVIMHNNPTWVAVAVGW
jgi:hypothetical protein